MNYYDLLGISPNATPAQIREAYRRLAKQYHPDRFHRMSETGKKYVEEKMLLLNEAFRVLSDLEERQKYDQENRGHPVSSKTYARYVDLDWKLAQLLGKEKIRKRRLDRVNHNRTISLAWVRVMSFPIFLFADFTRQPAFAFDLLMIFLMLFVGTNIKQFNWRSKTSVGFWISLGCLWGWIFFILPDFPFFPNSYLELGIPLFLFLVNQALFFQLYYLAQKENNEQRLHEQTAGQHEMIQIMLELKKLEDEIFGSEKRPFGQTRYN